ncbi:hypothetical protein PYCCODRAFT_1429492 [Trametes coccinea BRFM310]|uniref:Uncharacterized protein n=1 Tax=Trametes coccinea (strain BRFM310) TaxID=1353009 RepID=A0A1Y2J6D0_TRAC3|nr:hypothetical protein PYCCODRAFT_1429492 [Trametes coccinea BRFM310]
MVSCGTSAHTIAHIRVPARPTCEPPTKRGPLSANARTRAGDGPSIHGTPAGLYVLPCLLCAIGSFRLRSSRAWRCAGAVRRDWRAWEIGSCWNVLDVSSDFASLAQAGKPRCHLLHKLMEL